MNNPMSQLPEGGQEIQLQHHSGAFTSAVYWPAQHGKPNRILYFGDDADYDWNKESVDYDGWRPLNKPPVEVVWQELSTGSFVAAVSGSVRIDFEVGEHEVDEGMYEYHWMVNASGDQVAYDNCGDGTLKEAQDAAIAWYNENIANLVELK